MPELPNVPWWIAFVAGTLSILTPCVLALLPAYLTFLSGTATEPQTPGQGPGRRPAAPAAGARQGRVLLCAALFVAGFSTVFTAFGASASLAGQVLIQNQVLLRQAAGVIVFLLGLHTAGILSIPSLERERRVQVRGRPGHPLHAFVMGTAFAAGWTPCVGPILGSILLLAGTGSTVWAGVGLLLAYAAGMAVPFLLLAAFLGRSQRLVRCLSRFGRIVSVLGGAFLMAVGIMLFTGFFARLAGLFELPWLP